MFRGGVLLTIFGDTYYGFRIVRNEQRCVIENALFLGVLLGLLLVLSLSACSGGTSASTQSSQATSSSTATTVDGITLRYLDVGQGDSTLIECGGHWMLIDGGNNDKSSTIYTILQKLSVPKLDVIVATHPDADHIGGISGALNYTTCDVLYYSTTTSDTKTFSNMVSYLEKSSGIGITVPTVGESFLLGSAKVTFLGPVRSFDSDNNNSLIIKIEYGSTSFLFTGDAEKEAENALVNSVEDLSADVLQVGHHGSKNSSTTSFLKAASPKYSVVSVGENSYGHPTQAALDRLESVGSVILRTDELGDITFTSDGTHLTYSTGKVA